MHPHMSAGEESMALQLVRLIASLDAGAGLSRDVILEMWVAEGGTDATFVTACAAAIELAWARSRPDWSSVLVLTPSGREAARPRVRPG